MVSSADVRSEVTFGEFIFDFDIQRVRSAVWDLWITDFDAYGFARMVKEISRGDRTCEDTILRLWGIRRYD